MEEPPSLVRKKAAPEGAASLSSWEGGAFALKLEVHAATDIAEVEAIKLQRHVIQIFVDQVERGFVKVLVHSVKVESRRLEGLVESDEPILDVGLSDLGRKRYARKRIGT